MSNSRCDIDLQIDFTGALTVKWTGAANERRPGAALTPLFERLLSTKRYLRFDFSELEHMSYDDIAESLGVPLPTVKTRLLRARRTLATALGEWKS